LGGTSFASSLTPSELESNKANLDALQQSTAEWIRVERTIKEEEDRGRQQLNQLKHLKDVVQSQKDRWKQEALALKASASKADEERKRLLEMQVGHKRSREKALVQLKTLESQLRGLKAMAPQPLLKELAVSFLKLERPFKEKDWLDRYQACMTILQATHAFHRRYSVAQHDVSIEEQKAQAGTVLYIGLSNAYFISVDGKNAAIGRPNSKGWVWTGAKGHLNSIQEAIALAEGKSLDFELANLPVEVQP